METSHIALVSAEDCNKTLLCVVEVENFFPLLLDLKNFVAYKWTIFLSDIGTFQFNS